MAALEALSRRLAAVDIEGVDAGDELKFQAVLSATTFFLNPEPTEPTNLKDQDAWKPYLHKVKQNVMAEYWAFVESNSHGFPRWRSKRLKVLNLVPREQTEEDELLYEVVDPKSRQNDGGNFHMTLVVWQSKLCILKKAGQRNSGDEELTLYLLKCGMSIQQRWPDVADQGDESVVFVYGYIGDRVNELISVETLLCHPEAPSLLRSVAYPTRRESAPFDMHQRLPETGEDLSVPINAGQREVLGALRNDIEFIQGPPGTGKSTTIFHLINTFVSAAECALVSCVSNKAIDSIAEKFARQLPFIVVGRDERVGATARQWTLEAQVKNDPDVMRYEAVKEEFLEASEILSLEKDDPLMRQNATAARLLEVFERSPLEDLQLCAEATQRRATAKNVFDVLSLFVEEALIITSEELNKNKRRASLAIRRACRAVMATIDSCGSAVATLDNLDMDRDDAETSCIAARLSLAVLDEAGTIPEAKVCVIIATLPQITRIVAIGDQQQLEPYTDIQRRRGAQATQGYFHRTARVLYNEVPMLSTQFRMHPQICRLVSSLAYDGNLHTDQAVAAQREAASGPRAISWISYTADGAGESKSAGGSSSLKNEQELKIICDQAVIELGVLRPQKKRLLIITFYREQLKLLRDELADIGVLGMDKKTGLPIDPEDGHVRVTTVDSAQGSEADCVILGMVRCNPRGDVGFLANQNRAVVAISRAKDRLIIVGHEETVAARGLWRRVCNESQLTVSAISTAEVQARGGRSFEVRRRGDNGSWPSTGGDWPCLICGTSNFPRRSVCFKCDSPR